MVKDERIRFRCTETTKRTFDTFAAQFDSKEQALVALLDAYGDQENELQTVSFDFSRLKDQLAE